MKPRDRMVLVSVVAIFVVGAVWLKVVSPERAKVRTAQSKVAAASQALQSARAELSAAKGAQEKYAEAYASIVRLGKAVPAQEEVPALVYELEHAANSRHVEFASVTSGGSGSSSSGSSSSGSSSTASGGKAGAAASAQPAGFTQMPFTFTFTGSFADLYHLLATLQGFATYAAGDGLNVTGRLLTIQSVDLVPVTPSSGAPGGAASSEAKSPGSGSKAEAPGERLTGTVTATAYVLPPSVGLTGGATSSGPSGAGAGAGSSAPGSGSSAAPTAATIKAAP